MLAMARADVLARIEQDLDRGHTHPAMQRLASLVAAYPDDLDLRARRAALNRQIGNPVEAGRWGYLTENATDTEIRAFEQAIRPATRRLSCLRLPRDLRDHLGPAGRQRLTTLIEQVEHDQGAPVAFVDGRPHSKRPDTWGGRLGCVAFGLLILAVLALIVIGLGTTIGWLL
ncbi:MAG: hypothetical protein JXA67_00750 [Micromonosporaceae bacterium]|nr:hypothetical protein [Micromonosporaceae bacterium]